MAFQVPYKVSRSTPGGLLYQAVLNVRVAHERAREEPSQPFEALIDSGATLTVFSSQIAAAIGLELTSGRPTRMIGIGGEREAYLHDIFLFLPGGPVKVGAAFQDNLPFFGLLGMRGFFEYFDVRFDPVGACCVLERIFRV